MRKQSWIFGAVAVLVVCAGIAAWLHESKAEQNRVAAAIADINSYGKRLDKNLVMIRYESISTGGFPFGTSVTIHKPVIEIPVTALLERLDKKAVDQRRSRGAWTEIYDAGAIEIGAGSTPDENTFRVLGLVTNQTLVDHRLRTSFLTTAGDFACTAIGAGRLLDAFDTTNANANAKTQPLLTDAALHCKLRNRKTQDLASKALVYTEDESSVDVGNAASKDANRNLLLRSHVANGRYTPAANVPIKRWVGAIVESLGLPKGVYDRSIAVSEYGRIDYDLDAAYDGPMDRAGLSAKNKAFRFDINRYDLKNALTNATLNMHVVSNGDDKAKDVFETHGRLEVAERYDILARYAAGDAAARALVPQLHALSPIKLDVDMSGGIANVAARAQESSLKIQTADIDAKPYGLALRGDYWHREALQFSDLTLTCRNCDRLISDLEAYVAHAQVATVQAGRKLPVQVSYGQFESTRRLLHRIADVPGKRNETLVLHVEKTPDGEPTVNGKSLLDIMTLMQMP